MKHRIFGQKQNAEYTDRKGAYLIPFDGEKTAVVRTPIGYFLIGGGIENGESDGECIIKECLEETGFSVAVGDFICSAEEYTTHFSIGLFHPIQSYYSGRLCEKIKDPVEGDHKLEFVSLKDIRGKMFSKMQNFALEEFMSSMSVSEK